MCRRPAEDRGERADAVLSPEWAVRGRSRRWRTASGREPVGYFRPHRSEDRPFAVRRPGSENEEVRNGSFPPFRPSLWIAAGGGAVRRHVPAGVVDVRTKPNRAAVKDSGPIRLCFHGYVRPFGIFCRQDGKTSGGRSFFSEFFPERAGNVISPATSSRDGCSA